MGTMTRIACVALLAVGLGGCDRAAEELAERAAEQVTGADIEVDEDGVTIESDEGSFSIEADEEDGEVTMETDDGTFESATGRLPDDFPSVVPVVNGGELVAGTRIETEDGVAWNVNWEFTSGDPSDTLDAQVQALEDAGFTLDEEFSTTAGEGGMFGALLVGSGYRVNVSAIGEPDDFIVGYQVFEDQGEGEG